MVLFSFAHRTGGGTSPAVDHVHVGASGNTGKHEKANMRRHTMLEAGFKLATLLTKRLFMFITPIFAFHILLLFLLSSDIMSEGSIAIIKKFDFDFF